MTWAFPLTCKEVAEKENVCVWWGSIDSVRLTQKQASTSGLECVCVSVLLVAMPRQQNKQQPS